MAARKRKTALLIIDMLNTMQFPEAAQLRRFALPAARKIARLKEKLKKRGMPVIYVNDNFGQWKSDWEQVYEKCVEKKSLGKEMAEMLRPSPDDFFVLKPKHSGFYSTTLEVLLDDLGVRHLILTGMAGNLCVLFTANDAHMREYKVTVPRDCIASNTKKENEFTIKQLRDALQMKTPLSAEI
jgi:nicotinamidase-related amidase